MDNIDQSNADSRDSLDGFEFRPLTTGLGFQNRSQSGQVPHRKNGPSKVYGGESLELSRLNDENKNNTLQNQLYSLNRDQGVFAKENKSLEPAETFKIVLSYVVDVLFLSSILVLSNLLIMYSSNLPANFYIGQLFEGQLIHFNLYMFFALYLIYFSFLDTFCEGTFGKTIFKILLIDSNRSRLKFSQSLFRSITDIVSFLMLGIPALFNFQKEITETKFVKKLTKP